MNTTKNPVSEDDYQLRKYTQNSEKKGNVMNTMFFVLIFKKFRNMEKEQKDPI